MAKIRVGLIRCDLHAMWYGVLMYKHDPIVLRDDKVGRGQAAFFYFYTNYDNPRQIMIHPVGGFELARVWDADRKQAENMAEIFGKEVHVCDSFEEVSDNVDLVFIPDCNGDGKDHLELALPGLRKGIPTFVDKPFAYDVKDAQAIVRLAEENQTPVMSLSLLRVVPHAARFRNRLAELEQVEFGIVKGVGETMAGHIHAISLAQHIFGAGVESVECMGPAPLAYFHLDYGDKPDRPHAGVIVCCRAGGMYHCSSHVSAYSRWGAIHSPNIGDFEFPWGGVEVLQMVKKMVKTGKPQINYEEMIECIAIAGAARLAQEKGKRVHLREVMS